MNQAMDADCAEYFAGSKLIGDDYTPEQLKAWFNDEVNAYRDLRYADAVSESYFYHALNFRHGFRYIPQMVNGQVLGLGSAFGIELAPIARQVSRLTIVDPGDYHQIEHLSFKIEHLKAHWSGSIPLSNNTFDLAVSFGTLHHIANVTFVISEVARVMKPGAHLLIREPIVSMGDWRQTRKGLTKRERGIPLKLLNEAVKRAGLRVIAHALCMFPGISSLGALGRAPYNIPLVCALDDALCRLTAWNYSYHREHMLQKLAPSSTFLVVTKPHLKQ